MIEFGKILVKANSVEYVRILVRHNSVKFGYIQPNFGWGRCGRGWRILGLGRLGKILAEIDLIGFSWISAKADLALY